jgi:hypothetical protein
MVRRRSKLARTMLCILTALMASGLGAGRAAAQWTAIAVSQQVDNPAWGYSFRYGSKAQAERRAIAECNKHSSDHSCKVKLVFSGGGCGAFGFFLASTTLDDGRTGRIQLPISGMGDDERQAAAAFAKGCEVTGEQYRSLSTHNCNALALVCASRGLIKRGQ